MLKFTNIKLANGKSGARKGQGLIRLESHYVTDSGYSIGVSGDSADLDQDYYIVWNEWPTFTGSSADTNDVVSGTDLADIGITRLDFRAKATYGSGTLDIAIIRKSDRKAVRVTVTGGTAAHYKNTIADNATITTIAPKQGPWTPEIGRLRNQEQI